MSAPLATAGGALACSATPGAARWARSEGLTNTDGMRRMIRLTTGMPELVSLVDTGSSAEHVSRALPAGRA
jgi:hypothetical protein